MNRKTKKELMILIGLLSLLFLSVFSQFSKESSPVAAPAIARSRVAATTASNEGLAVGLLSAEVPEFEGVKRNIFQFGGGHRYSNPAQNFVPAAPPEPAVAAAPSMPPEVHYLGFYYEKDTGLKMASISNSGKIYVGKTGQVLGGKYQVLEIADDHVILKLLLQEGKILRVPLGKTPGSFIEWQEGANP